MAKTRKKPHGGRREGAGRKPHPDGKTVIIAASVPGELVDELDAFRKREGWNRSQAVTEAIRSLLAAKR